MSGSDKTAFFLGAWWSDRMLDLQWAEWVDGRHLCQCHGFGSKDHRLGSQHSPLAGFGYRSHFGTSLGQYPLTLGSPPTVDGCRDILCRSDCHIDVVSAIEGWGLAQHYLHSGDVGAAFHLRIFH